MQFFLYQRKTKNLICFSKNTNKKLKIKEIYYVVPLAGNGAMFYKGDFVCVKKYAIVSKVVIKHKYARAYLDSL